MTAVAPKSKIAEDAFLAAPASNQPQLPDMRLLPLADVHESPWNPRQHYDAVKLQELADSIAAKGQLTPALVRPRKKGGFELAAGHRRSRAVKLAGVPTLLAVVREMTDTEFLEVLVIENNQREDVHAMEEARGYAALMKSDGGYTVDRLAERVGRSVSYIYDRVKLLKLIPEAQTLFLENAFTPAHAILLARLSPKDQKRALGSERATTNDIGGLFTLEHANDELPLTEGTTTRGGNRHAGDRLKCVSVNEFASWIRDRVRFRPAEADPVLFPQTVAAVAAAEATKKAVLFITRDYMANDEVRDEKQRTIGRDHWKRAEGKTGAMNCAYAKLGVVVCGPGRGDSFLVCVEKKKCMVHWAATAKAAQKQERKAAGKAATSSGKQESARARDEREEARQEEARKRVELERARWRKALPEILKAMAEKIEKTPIAKLAPIVVKAAERVKDYYGARPGSYIEPGKNAESLVRFIVFAATAGQLRTDGYEQTADIMKAAGRFEINAQAIVDQVAPAPKPEKVQTTGKPAAKKAKKK